MKTITTSLLLAVLVSAMPSFAQAPAQPVPQPPQIRQPRPREIPPQFPGGLPSEAAEFPGNVKLSFEGSLFGAIPTDFSVLAGGPSFSTDFPGKPDPKAPVISSLSGVLQPGSAWTLQLSIAAQVPQETGNGNLQYRDVSFRTTVRLTPGKKVTLWEKGDQRLTVVLEEEKE